MIDPPQEIVVSRRVAFGPNAITTMANVCKDIGIGEVQIFSGNTATKRIAKEKIISIAAVSPI